MTEPSTRVPPDSIPFGLEAGEVTPSSLIYMGRDGVEQRRPNDGGFYTYSDNLVVVSPERHLDITTVFQIAGYKLLCGLRFHRINLPTMIATNTFHTSEFKLDRVVFDMPEPGEMAAPEPMAVILPAGECQYEHENLITSLIDDTRDAYGKGTVLRKVSSATQRMAIHFLSEKPEERRAIKSSIERSWLTEPDDDKSGRRVVIPQYYDRQVHVFTQTSDTDDAVPQSQANKRELIVLLEMSCDLVVLVKAPPGMDTTHRSSIGTQVGC